MNIDKLTLGELKELFGIFSGNSVLAQVLTTQDVPDQSGPWVVGKNYFIRTVIMHLTGTLKSVSEHELVLSDAAWIASSGRLSEFLENPECAAKEVELFNGDAIVGRGAIVDATVIKKIANKTK